MHQFLAFGPKRNPKKLFKCFYQCLFLGSGFIVEVRVQGLNYDIAINLRAIETSNQRLIGRGCFKPAPSQLISKNCTPNGQYDK